MHVSGRSGVVLVPFFSPLTSADSMGDALPNPGEGVRLASTSNEKNGFCGREGDGINFSELIGKPSPHDPRVARGFSLQSVSASFDKC